MRNLEDKENVEGFREDVESGKHRKLKRLSVGDRSAGLLDEKDLCDRDKSEKSSLSDRRNTSDKQVPKQSSKVAVVSSQALSKETENLVRVEEELRTPRKGDTGEKAFTKTARTDETSVDRREDKTSKSREGRKSKTKSKHHHGETDHHKTETVVTESQTIVKDHPAYAVSRQSVECRSSFDFEFLDIGFQPENFPHAAQQQAIEDINVKFKESVKDRSEKFIRDNEQKGELDSKRVKESKRSSKESRFTSEKLETDNVKKADGKPLDRQVKAENLVKTSDEAISTESSRSKSKERRYKEHRHRKEVTTRVEAQPTAEFKASSKRTNVETCETNEAKAKSCEVLNKEDENVPKLVKCKLRDTREATFKPPSKDLNKSDQDLLDVNKSHLKTSSSGEFIFRNEINYKLIKINKIKSDTNIKVNLSPDCLNVLERNNSKSTPNIFVDNAPFPEVKRRDSSLNAEKVEKSDQTINGARTGTGIDINIVKSNGELSVESSSNNLINLKEFKSEQKLISNLNDDLKNTNCLNEFKYLGKFSNNSHRSFSRYCIFKK